MQIQNFNYDYNVFYAESMIVKQEYESMPHTSTSF